MEARILTEAERMGRNKASRRAPLGSWLAAMAALLLVLGGLGCQGPAPKGRAIEEGDKVPTTLALAPGDVLEVTFPGATNLSGSYRLGPEGAITMPLVGAVQAGGKSALQVQDELTKLYETQLQDKEVIVRIAGSANMVYVTGAVLRPGRVILERPLTALEAILETGGFAPNANKKRVTVIRYEGNKNTLINLDLDPVYQGGEVTPFYLRPRDEVRVAEKIQWF